jgi:putative transposase
MAMTGALPSSLRYEYYKSMEYHDRKHPARQPVYDVNNRSNIISLTVCTDKRKKILANEPAHQIIRTAWQNADHWIVGRYMIMPDHIHLFCAPARHDHLSVKRWIAYWKSSASKAWHNPSEQPIWQIDAWDTQLRRGDSYSTKWAYVSNNPVRHKLVEHAEDWPFQGEMNQLMWHD